MLGLRSDLPLSGVRVLDLSSTIAGPSATRHLADFGAQVIKIESVVHPDNSRYSTPFAGGVRGLNRSGYFSAYAAGKLSITLNMRLPAAREVLRRLVTVSDVFIEAFAPGVIGRWGLSYDTLRAWNPAIIMVSHSLQGQTGPYSPQRGFGQLAAAFTGWFDLTGLPDEEPVGPYSAYTDFLAWPVLAASVLLALEQRDATGVGMYIDHSHVESSAYFAAPELLAAQLGHPPRRDGNHESGACPNNAYRCQGTDRWCALTVETDEQWAALCQTLAADDLLTDARYASHAGRKQHERELDAALTARIAPWDAAALAEKLCTAGVPAGVVAKAEDLFADRQIAHRHGFHRLPHAEMGEHAVVAPSFRIEGVDNGPHRAFPLLGEHTDYLCREVLGLSDDALAELAASGVFE